jgi:hypothetical protein
MGKVRERVRRSRAAHIQWRNSGECVTTCTTGIRNVRFLG